MNEYSGNKWEDLEFIPYLILNDKYIQIDGLKKAKKVFELVKEANKLEEKVMKIIGLQ